MAIPDWALKKDVRRSNNTREISGSFPPGGAQVVAGAAPSETSRRSRKERSDRHRRGERSTRRRRRREESSPDCPSRSEKTRRDEGSGIPRGLAPREGRPREKSRNPEEFKPSGADAKRIRLGKTSGVLAAGAWAAREEIAKLIEEGHRSPDILRAIRDAREDSPELGQQPKFLPVEKGRASKDSSGTPREGTRSLAESSQGSSAAAAWSQLFNSPGIGRFRKTALPPRREESPDNRASEEASESSGYRPSSSDPKEERKDDIFYEPKLASLGNDLDGFRKKAARPKQVAVPVKGTSPPKHVPKSFPRRSNPLEQQKLDDYFRRTRNVFEAMVVGNVTMDLVGLVVDEKSDIDDFKFKMYTEPRKVGTGLRYARLMEKLVSFHEDRFGDAKDAPTVVSKDCVLRFLEWNMENECGFRTPKAVLYAVEFYSIIFGFEEPGSRWPRCKKLADDYARKAPERNPAEFLDVMFLDYLEKAVLDSSRSLAERVTSGKLRLCAQASIRHDDLTNTPLGRTEWCRLRGGTSILGLRAKASTTKTGPRPWVASYLGVNPANDEWLRVFVETVLSAHGDSWKERSFFSPGFLEEGISMGQPAGLSSDVAIIKRMMMRDLEAERSVPLSKEGIAKFRWHGAKASMPTFMSHFHIRGKIIRFQGAWAKQADSMPDTYLREAQVMVLTGQIQTLEKIRGGEGVSSLVGVGLDRRGQTAEGVAGSADEGGVPSAKSEAERVDRAMEQPKVKPIIVEDDQGRLNFVEGELPDSSNFPDQLMDTRLKDLAEKKVSSRELFALLADENAEAAAFSPEDLDAATELLSLEDAELPSDDSEASVEVHDMELLRCLVGIPKGKYHKPAESFQLEVPSAPTPLCKVASTQGFDMVNLEEALPGDASFCVRCFGKPGKCQSICSYKTTKKGATLRCSRRCCLNCNAGGPNADLRVHSCAFHLEKLMDQET